VPIYWKEARLLETRPVIAKINNRKLLVYNRFSRGDVAQLVRAADS
jgi:hypothetical protein